MTNYFKGLDSLRAIAALMVVLGHIEILKNINNFPSVTNQSKNNLPDGHLGVVLFFVLSGFLITYLLIQEKEKNNFISLKKFYLRRIFRIWPVYYLVLFASYFLFDEKYNSISILLCLGIFPNIAHALNLGWPSSPQIWSIGVEEQYYLFWPILISYLPNKRVIPILIFFFIGYTALPLLIGLIDIKIISN